MRTDTVTADIIDVEFILIIDEATNALERLNGTYETYGSFTVVRPTLSSKGSYSRLNQEAA